MEFLKKLIIALLTLLLVTTLALWVVAKSVKPEVVKQYLSSQLSTLNHQKCSVDGDISWQIFPQPGIKITKVQIGGENNQANYSVNLENLFFNLQITPLFRGKLVFNELIVDGFKIKVYPDVPCPPAKTKVLTQDDEAKTSTAEQFAIERILLSHGQIVIVQNQRAITLSGLQVGAQEFNLQQKLFPLQFKTNLEITTNNEKILKAHINFKGNTSLSPSLFSKPITTLQNTALDGQLSLQNIKFNRLKIDKISAHTKTKSGAFLLNLLTLNLYNGESVGDLSYEFATKKLSINQTATNLAGAKLINDLLQKTLFTGSVDFSIHAQTNLQETNWQDNISGNGSLTIKDGVVESIDLGKVIEETSNQINKLLTTQEAANTHTLDLKQLANPNLFKGSTNFKLLTLQYHLQDATLASNSLVLQTDNLQIKGDSILHLKDNNLDSHLLAKVTLADDNIDKIQQMLGGTFPILLQGTLTEPSVLPDLQKINPIPIPLAKTANKERAQN
jgi:AsmA protein